LVHDLGSTNGTWVDGKRVEHAPVAAGSVLRVGDWVGVFVRELEGAPGFGELAPDLFGGSAMAELLAPLVRAGTSNLPVLLIGATGTGKERLARAAHHFSGRTGEFVAVNCAALPEQLAEAELFGYRRGAFTGAERANSGHFRAAHRGTLFLDEMPELSLALQAKLLRVLEDGQVMGLGESSTTKVDVRIVSASQRPLREQVAQGRLRQDLAARLNGLELCIPALADRRADIASLFEQFLQRTSGGRTPKVEGRLIEALCLHGWPENVRELELVARRLLAVHGHEQTLRHQHLPPEIAALNEDKRSHRSAPPRSRREHDLARVQQALAQRGGNVRAVAAELGLSRQRIYRLLQDADVRAKDGSPRPGTDD
jgi:transcriptional regulator with PAS, ATPase and Fis domain